MMIDTKPPQPPQGFVRTFLIVWTLLLLAAGGFWLWQRTDRPIPSSPLTPLAAYCLQVDPNRTGSVSLRLDLRCPLEPDKRTVVTLAGPAGCFGVEVQDPRGNVVPHLKNRGEVSFEMKEAGTYCIRYAVPLGIRSDAVFTSIITRFGGAARLKDLLLLPVTALPMTFSAELPVGWMLHSPGGLGNNGFLTRQMLAQGAVAWTHSANQSLVSPPNAVEVFFLGKPGVGDPILPMLEKMVQWLLKDVVVNRPLKHRLILVNLKAPHHRLLLPPQRDWQILERGPGTLNRLVRIARGILGIYLPRTSATPPGPDAPWYPAALQYFGSYRAAEEAGGRSPLPWAGLWGIQEREYLWERNQKNSPRAAALKGATVLRDISLVCPNANSIRLLSEPSRNKSTKDLHTAIAMQLHLGDKTWLEKARGAGVHLSQESPWRLPVLYEDPGKPAGSDGAMNLRLLVTGETYAEVMGCTGCPAPGTMAQRVYRQQARAREGVPTLVLSAGDWTPFFLSEDPTPEAFKDRLEIARLAAAHAGAAALVIGPGEVGWGRERLKDLITGKGAVPLISANLQLEDGTAPRSHVIQSVGGLTVAVIGLTDFPRRRYRLAWFEEALRGMKVEYPVVAAARVAKKVKAAVDLVVVAGAIDPIHARLIAFGNPDVDLVVSSAPGFDRPPAKGKEAFTAHDHSGFLGRTPVLYTSGSRGSLHRFDLKIGKMNRHGQVLDFLSVSEKLKKSDLVDPVVQKKEVEYQGRHAGLTHTRNPEK